MGIVFLWDFDLQLLFGQLKSFDLHTFVWFIFKFCLTNVKCFMFLKGIVTLKGIGLLIVM